MNQTLCERTVGGPWACHLRLRGHVAVKHSLLELFVAAVVSQTQVSEDDWRSVVRGPCCTLTLRIFLHAEPIWGNEMQGWIWRHTKHTEYLILQWQKDSIVAGLSVSHSPSLDVAEQHQFEGRQMLKHSRDMLVKEHTWENAIWEKVTFLGVAIDHKI